MVENSYSSTIKLLENELDILFSLFLKINIDMNLDDFLNEIIFTLREKIEFDGCNFALIDKQGYMQIHKIDPTRISRKSNLTEEYLEKVYAQKIEYQKSNDWASIVAREKREIHIPEVNMQDYSQGEQEFLVNYGITGLYYLPIFIDDKLFGTMRLHNYESTMPLDETKKAIIRRRVSVIAKALENYYLYNDIKEKSEIIQLDLELAERLQQSLLPHDIPDIPGIEIATTYIPRIDVGGDFFDFLYSSKMKNERSFGLLITDASGHGVSAAFITTMLKMSFQNKDVYRKSESPGKVLAHMNKMILNKTAENFVTGCYAYFNIKKGKMILSSAGHEAVLKINRKNGEIQSLKPKGKVIGLFDAPWYEELVVDLESGTRYLFYTDGLIEAIDSNGKRFEEKLIAICYRDIKSNAIDFCKAIVVGLQKHVLTGVKNSFDDDVAAVVIDIV